MFEHDQIERSCPYYLQRIELGRETRPKRPDHPNHPMKVSKVDYRKVKCVHGGVPETYEKKAYNNPDAMREAREKIYSYDYMGSAEFEFGALPVANWKFLRAFEKGQGVIRRIEIVDSKTGLMEKFWIFAPKVTEDLAIALLRYVCYGVVHSGRSNISLKEGLRYDRYLFPAPKGDDGFSRSDSAFEERMQNEVNGIGWFDIRNCYYIFWDRGDIAQAFANLHNFGNVLNLEVEEYDVRDGFSGSLEYSRDYFRKILEG